MIEIGKTSSGLSTFLLAKIWRLTLLFMHHNTSSTWDVSKGNDSIIVYFWNSSVGFYWD